MTKNFNASLAHCFARIHQIKAVANYNLKLQLQIVRNQPFHEADGIRSPLKGLSLSMTKRELMSRTPYISKSKFLQGLQCPMLLWNAYNAKHLFPDVDDATQAVFDQGHEVGSLAKRMFPDGIEIESDPADFEGAIQLTQNALPLRIPIFEATLSANGGYARADILNPVGKDAWDIIEVKSTTRFKDVHIPDLAFQTWVFTEAGIKIRRCFLCHINNEFVRNGDIDPKQFFALRDVTAEVLELSNGIAEQVRQMQKIIGLAKCPETRIGKQCDTPYTCPLHQNCWSFLPTQNVLELYFDTKGRGFELLNRRVLRIADIPEDYPLLPMLASPAAKF
jgi:hypothetical protein